MADATGALDGEAILSRIVSYWYDCIKTEDALEKDITINVRSRAVLYPFDFDPFIFGQSDATVNDANERLHDFYTRCIVEGLDTFYGYPLLCYQDDATKKTMVAPLLVIKLRASRDSSGDVEFDKAEPAPTFGIQALSRLGLRTEEIGALNRDLETLIIARSFTPTAILDLLSKEIIVPLSESLDPEHLTNSKRLGDKSYGLFNKSMLFAGDATLYNARLLDDLDGLRKMRGLSRTALGFIVSAAPSVEPPKLVPILPFAANEYQIHALRQVQVAPLSVVTGPPGTGKSQFICNILINLFLSGHTCLL